MQDGRANVPFFRASDLSSLACVFVPGGMCLFAAAVSITLSLLLVPLPNTPFRPISRYSSIVYFSKSKPPPSSTICDSPENRETRIAMRVVNRDVRRERCTAAPEFCRVKKLYYASRTQQHGVCLHRYDDGGAAAVLCVHIPTTNALTSCSWFFCFGFCLCLKRDAKEKKNRTLV